MATAFPLPVTAAQVGTYFVGQYYQMLQNQPDFIHQFYSDASTMLRIDGNTRETATAMLLWFPSFIISGISALTLKKGTSCIYELASGMTQQLFKLELALDQIHQLVMSLNYTGIEIKTAHSLESWNGGVLVMVSGSVHAKDFNGRKKFIETFFLAPQEKGYFVLNDIFHYVDEEQILQHPIAYLSQSNIDSKLHSSATVREQVSLGMVEDESRTVSNYMLGADVQPREFPASAKIEDDGPVNNYNYREEQIAQVPETENILDDKFVQSNGSLQGTMNSLPDNLSSPIEEPVSEPQKHTYASIVAKGQSSPAVPSQSSSHKPAAPSEWQHIPETPGQPSVAPSNTTERSVIETLEETSALEDEVEVKSVYVRNVPTTMAASEIGEEFKKFGKLKPDGVAIRTRKDIDVCYAFVEFEDVSGVQNAIKASMVQIGGHQLYIEGGDRTEITPFEGEALKCVRSGWVSYQMDGTRGRFGGRGFGRVSNQDGLDRDYNRPRGNGFYRQAPRLERPYSANQQGSRNGQISSE
ncbi:Nuclear transport factor 2 [Sesamum angolense]|uniref:Nuclear transport factor 2 n=1 Tax=Sesamum angolense TaxID=2727404 RepID=A0AAE2BJW2_9LAMI|nr:Nuclear transport factor 2 [Sesamum angolense]